MLTCATIVFGFLHFLLLPLLFGFALLATIFWIWMLVDCARRISNGDNRQIGWLIVIVVAHGLGALVYFLFGRERPPGIRL